MKLPYITIAQAPSTPSIPDPSTMQDTAASASIAKEAVETADKPFVDQLLDIFIGMKDSLMKALPDLFIAIIIVVVGAIVATIIKFIVTKVLKGIKFDELLKNAGLGDILGKAGMKNGATPVIGKLIFWVIMLFMIKSAADKMGVEDISNIITSLMNFLPKLAISVIILLVGTMVADIIKNAVFNTLDNYGLDYAKALAGIVFGFVFVIVLTVALSQLAIDTELLKDSVKIILASLGLGLSICLGLGLKGLANQIISGVYARDIYKVGTIINLDGVEAKIAGVGPVTTKLIAPEGFIIIPNNELVNYRVIGKSAE